MVAAPSPPPGPELPPATDAPSPSDIASGRPQSASRSLLWSLGGQVATMLASMVSTVVLARILTPTDFGAFAFGATVYAVVQWLLQVGMGNYILREAELGQAKIDGAVAIACGQGLVSALIVLALAPFAGWFSHYATVGWVTAAVAIVPLLGAPEGISDSLWLRDGRYARVALLQVAKAAIQSIVSIACQLLFHWGVFALVAGLVAAALTSFAAAAWSLVRDYRARPRLDREIAGTLRGFGGRTFLVTLAQILSLRLPDLLIGRLLSVGLLGHYNRASQAIDMFARTTSAAVTRATAPRFYRSAHEGVALPAATVRYCDTLLFFVWPALAGLAMLSGPVVSLVYGPQWGIAGRALPFLCLTCAIDCARTGYSEVLLIRDRLGLNAGIEFAHGGYAILLVVLLAPFGLTAVLWGKVAESTLTTIVYLFYMRRLDAHSARAWPRLFGRNALLALAAGGPAWLLMRAWGWPARLGPAGFAATIAGGIAAWLVALALIGHPNMIAAREILRRRLGARAAKALP